MIHQCTLQSQSFLVSKYNLGVLDISIFRWTHWTSISVQDNQQGRGGRALEERSEPHHLYNTVHTCVSACEKGWSPVSIRDSGGEERSHWWQYVPDESSWHDLTCDLSLFCMLIDPTVPTNHSKRGPWRKLASSWFPLYWRSCHYPEAVNLPNAQSSG